MGLYCDLDEVLTDFTGAALAVHGWTREKLEAVREPGVWDIARAMGLTDDEFWEPIHDAGIRFWTSIEFLPWAKEMVHLLDDTIGILSYTILTSPCRHVSSYVGKQNYIQRHFGDTPYVIWKDKHQLAEGNLLIDDSENNVNRWVKYGGRAILFPSRGNRLYAMADNPVPYVKERLTELCN